MEHQGVCQRERQRERQGERLEMESSAKESAQMPLPGRHMVWQALPAPQPAAPLSPLALLTYRLSIAIHKTNAHKTQGLPSTL